MRGIVTLAEGSSVVSSVCFEAILSAQALLQDLDCKAGKPVGLALSLGCDSIQFKCKWADRSVDSKRLDEWIACDGKHMSTTPSTSQFRNVFATAKQLYFDFIELDGCDAQARALAHCKAEPKTECLRYQDFLQFAHEDESMRQAAAARKNKLLNKCSIPEAADYAVMKLLQPVQMGFDDTDRDALAILFRLNRSLFELCASYHLAFVAQNEAERMAFIDAYRFAGRAYTEVKIGVQVWHRLARQLFNAKRRGGQRLEKMCFLNESDASAKMVQLPESVDKCTHAILSDMVESPDFVSSFRSLLETVTYKGSIEGEEVLNKLTRNGYCGVLGTTSYYLRLLAADSARSEEE